MQEIKQKLIERYGKKFAAATTGTDPIYQGVFYQEGGNIYATNRHYALRIKDAHSMDSSVVLHAKTGMPLKGTYNENIERVFPTSFKNSISLMNGLDDELLRVRCAADVASRIDKKIPVVRLEGSNGVVHLEIDNKEQKINYKAFFGNLDKTEPFIISLNPEYLYTGLKVFSDAGSRVSVKYTGSMSPLVLTNDADIDVVILPFRTAD